jgi:Spy/CpxP family protein refolding chaperone
VAGVAVIVAAAVAVAAITVAAAAAGNPSAEPSSSIHSADPSQGPPFLYPKGQQIKLPP